MKFPSLLIWWSARNIREKKVLKTGLLIVLAVLAYYFLALPLKQSVDSAKQKWLKNQQLLAWIQPRVEFLKHERASQPKAPEASQLLANLHSAIEQSQLKKPLLEMTQSTEKSAVTLKLEAVNFDELIVWLGQQKEKQGLEVRELTATTKATAEPGIVDVTFTIGDPKI
jgi:general secretion pathway protein M